MKAMIFAAGLGTRLYPITLNIPKALVEVGGKPMLQHVLDKLPALGIKDVVVNVHHHADKVERYLGDLMATMSINVSDERDCLLDTGGGVVKAMPWLHGEEVLLHNADILTDVSIMDMVEYHRDSEADVTLLVSKRETSRYLLVDDFMRMRGWVNVKTGAVRPKDLPVEYLNNKVAFGGVHILSPRALDAIQSYKDIGTPFSITDFYIDSVDTLKIQCFIPQDNYMWYDIGKPETLAAAREALKSRKKIVE
ncbi:MAG: nucleotidyltransferase family protein [Paramuribaculum sp.]|nr:nucleotidyltransferase family protein [Paramuribaculum sp.]